jgi:hypothetical protein
MLAHLFPHTGRGLHASCPVILLSDRHLAQKDGVPKLAIGTPVDERNRFSLGRRAGMVKANPPAATYPPRPG